MEMKLIDENWHYRPLDYIVDQTLQNYTSFWNCENYFYVPKPILEQFTYTFNLLKLNGHVMHQQFNIQQPYVLPTHCIYVFCIYLIINSDLCHLQHKLIGFYNWDEKCLLRGTNWVFN